MFFPKGIQLLISSTAYGTYFFLMANVGRPFENSCILQAVGLAAILANSVLSPKIGRRRVCLVTGLLICGAAMVIMAAVYQKNPLASATGKLVIAMTMIHMVSYSVRLSLDRNILFQRLTYLGYYRSICLGIWRRASFSASPLIHIRRCVCRWLLLRLAYNFYCPLFH